MTIQPQFLMPFAIFATIPALFLEWARAEKERSQLLESTGHALTSRWARALKRPFQTLAIG